MISRRMLYAAGGFVLVLLGVWLWTSRGAGDPPQGFAKTNGRIEAERIDIATKFVLHKDVKIEVKNDEGKLGTVLVSKGNIEWLPAGNSRRQQFHHCFLKSPIRELAAHQQFAASG